METRIKQKAAPLSFFFPNRIRPPAFEWWQLYWNYNFNYTGPNENLKIKNQVQSHLRNASEITRKNSIGTWTCLHTAAIFDTARVLLYSRPAILHVINVLWRHTLVSTSTSMSSSQSNLQNYCKILDVVLLGNCKLQTGSPRLMRLQS